MTNHPCDLWTLMGLSPEDASDKFIATRRFLTSGFALDDRYHEDGVLGLSSANQTIQLDLRNGELTHVARTFAS